MNAARRIRLKNEINARLKRRPSFSNYYKTCVVYKYYYIDEDDFRGIQVWIEHNHLPLAVKRSTYRSMLVFFPKPDAPPNARETWLKRPTNSDLYPNVETYVQAKSAAISDYLARKGLS